MFSLFSSSSIPTRADPPPRQPQLSRAATRPSPPRREVPLSDLARRYGGDAPIPADYRGASRPRRDSRESSINDLHRRYGNPQSQSAGRSGYPYRTANGGQVDLVQGYVNDEASYRQFMANKRARDETRQVRGHNAPVSPTSRPSRPPTGQLEASLRRARDAGVRRAALREFVGHALSQYEPSKVRSTLVYLEGEMPRFAGDIRHTRHEYGLTSQPSSQRSSPRSSTSSNRSSPSRRMRSSSSQNTSPTTSPTSTSSAPSPRHTRHTVRVEEHPDDDLPPYAEHDPDPGSTRLLAQRLAAEAEEMLELTGEIAALAVSPPDHAHTARGSTESLGLVLGEAPPYEARAVEA